MAVSKKSLQTLLTHGENDNSPLPIEVMRPIGRARALTHGPWLDLDLPCLATRFEPESGILWARMRHGERACYTRELMRDIRALQSMLRELYTGRHAAQVPVRYLVWASDAPKAWSLGGDLDFFIQMIRAGDDRALRSYAHLAIDLIHDNYLSMELPILTVALVQGDAVAGGFEAMLTDDIVIAERGAKFGLPEVLFNMFPGMGAYSLLRRRVGEVTARRLIEDGLTRTTDEMKELGLIDIVCEPGQAETALRRFVEDSSARFNTLRTMAAVRRRVDPLGRRELVDVVDMWVELAMNLGEAELRRMSCLARVQERRRQGG